MPPGTSESPRQPYVLSVGAQTGRKRFDLLIRALSQVPSEMRLVLVGSGSDRARLKRCARDEGVAARVTFLDHVDESELSQLYRGARVYALASTREGFPATLIEAALSGTPTLYFTEAPHPDLEDSQSDFFRVIHSLEPAQVAEAIDQACALPPAAIPGRRQIAQWARSRFPAPETVAGAIGRIYAGVAESALIPEGVQATA